MWSSSAPRRRTPRFVPFVPQLEPLEDRDLPTILVALTKDNTLLTFDSALSTAVVSKTVTGVLPGESLQDIAVRPANGQLYGLSFGHLYRLDPTTGAASPVGDPQISLDLSGNQLVMSFDPVADRLRVVTAQVVDKVTQSEHNLTLAPDTGGVVSTGTAPQYAAGDIQFGRTPRLGHLAYTNEFSGATATTLYGVDDLPQVPDRLVTIGGPGGVPSPDQGQVHTVGPTAGWSGFTIAGTANTAFAVSQDDNSLWTVDLKNGAGIKVGPSGIAAEVTALAALVSPPVPPPPPPPPDSGPAVSIDDVTVNETPGGVVDATFTVALSAPSTQAVTVQVRTRDGTASSPQEYQPLALTTLTFAPGQTTQTVTVQVGDNQLMGGVESFFVVLSNPSNATLAKAQGIGTIANHPLVMPPANVMLVESLYLDLLGRLPDAAGQAVWQHLLDAGVPRELVAQAIINSPEYLIHQVQDLYARLLGRPADPVGLQGAVAALAGGMSFGLLEAILLGSAEYQNRHGATPAGFLQGVYADLLGRPISSAEAALWGQLLAAGQSPALVAALIANSVEAVQSLVNARYRHFLRRNAEPAASQALTRALLGSPSNLLSGFLLDELLATSVEHITRVIPRELLELAYFAKVSHDLLGHSPDPGALTQWMAQISQGVSREQVVYNNILTSDEFHRRVITQGSLPPFLPSIPATDPRFAAALAVFGDSSLFGGGYMLDENVYLFLQTDFTVPGNNTQDTNFVLDLFSTFLGLQVDLGNTTDPLVLQVVDDLNSSNPQTFELLAYEVVNGSLTPTTPPLDARPGLFRAQQFYSLFLGTTQSPPAAESVGLRYPDARDSTFGTLQGFFIHGSVISSSSLLTSRLDKTEELFLADVLGTSEYYPRF
jgi:hypothetical protein